MVPTEKVCSKCHRTKALTEFSRDRKARDGYRSVCKACASGLFAAWWQENRPDILQRKARYRAEHPDRVAQSHARYEDRHRSRIRARKVRFYREHPDRVRQWQQKWFLAHRICNSRRGVGRLPAQLRLFG